MGIGVVNTTSYCPSAVLVTEATLKDAANVPLSSDVDPQASVPVPPLGGAALVAKTAKDVPMFVIAALSVLQVL